MWVGGRGGSPERSRGLRLGLALVLAPPVAGVVKGLGSAGHDLTSVDAVLCPGCGMRDDLCDGERGVG